jgi:hypothetical protein
LPPAVAHPRPHAPLPLVRRVTPAMLQQVRAFGRKHIQEINIQMFQEIRAALEDLHPDDVACGAGGSRGDGHGSGAARAAAATPSGPPRGTASGASRSGAGARGRRRRAPKRRPEESKADAAARIALARARLARIGRELLTLNTFGVSHACTPPQGA